MVEPEEVFDLLADDYAREILALANRESMSARELADACDAHHSTIYRRIEALQSHGLLAEQLQLDPDGHHFHVYRTVLEGISIRVNENEFLVQIETREDSVDRMAKMWRQIRGEEQ